MAVRRFFSSPWRALGFLVLVVITFLWLVPFLQAILTSMRTNTDIMTRGFFSLPDQISFESFAEAWRRGGLSYYLPNSFIITIPALFLTLLLSSLSAYALARYRFRGNRLDSIEVTAAKDGAGRPLTFPDVTLPSETRLNAFA